MDAAGAYKIEVDRLMRYSGWHLLGTARMGDDPKTSVARPLEPGPRRPEPVRRRRLVLRHLVRRQPDLDDRGHRAARGRPHGRDPVRAAGAGMTDAPDGRPIRSTDARRADERRALRGGRRPPDPGRARHALGGRRRRATTGCGSCSTPRPDLVEPLRAALRPELGDDAAAAGSTRSAGTSRPTSARSSSPSSPATTPTAASAS